MAVFSIFSLVSVCCLGYALADKLIYNRHQFDISGFDLCSIDPGNIRCIDYKYPAINATQDLENLCKMMPWMPGCTIFGFCKKITSTRPIATRPNWCNEISLLGNICKADTMSGMGGCKHAYNRLCGNSSSVIEDCTDNQPINHIPTTKQAIDVVKKMCLHSDHIMDQCNDCDLNEARTCNYFGMYISMCYEMPGMEGCELYGKICSDSILKGQLPVCESSDDSGVPNDNSDFDLPPIMRMYFHGGFKEYILFKTWLPRNLSSYIASCIAIILFGVLYEFLITARAMLEFKWSYLNGQNSMGIGNAGEDCECPPGSSSASSGKQQAKTISQQDISLGDIYDEQEQLLRPGYYFKNAYPMFQKFSLSRDFTRGFLQFFETALSYSLMLIAMTYNSGIFISVCLGMGIGTFIFGRYRTFSGTPRRCC